MRSLLLLPLLLAATPLAARDCRFGGQSINPDNASYYAGKSGRIECFDEDGELQSVDEVRDGELVGYQKHRDLWGNWSERTVNANGNTQGVAKEFWPDGTLKSEGTYEDGDLAGVLRTFHKNGKPQRIAHSDGAALEYDDRGQLKWLTCGKASAMPEDRTPCGFAGKATTVLHLAAGKQLRVTYERGQLVAQEDVAAGGNTTATATLEGDAEVRRTFHPDGKPASELRVVDGFHVEERTWYMNGQLETRTVREPLERNARSDTRRYRDDGTLAQVDVVIGRTQVRREGYDKAGKLAQIEDFDAAGLLARRRKYAADGSVASDESFYPDGSRK